MFQRNYNLNVKVARFHNIFGPFGTWTGGKEKPQQLCVESRRNHRSCRYGAMISESFMYIDECIKATIKFVRQDNFRGPVNIGSEEMVI